VRREGTKPASPDGREHVAAQQPAQALAALTDEEKTLLDLLVASGAAKTAAQLSTASGLPKETVIVAVDGLRSRGLVTRLNTVVESYRAAFPGLEVR
jgi:DNA-binding IclR family transcriptional regulator